MKKEIISFTSDIGVALDLTVLVLRDDEFVEFCGHFDQLGVIPSEAVVDALNAGYVPYIGIGRGTRPLFHVYEVETPNMSVVLEGFAGSWISALKNGKAILPLVAYKYGPDFSTN